MCPRWNYRQKTHGSHLQEYLVSDMSVCLPSREDHVLRVLHEEILTLMFFFDPTHATHNISSLRRSHSCELVPRWKCTLPRNGRINRCEIKSRECSQYVLTSTQQTCLSSNGQTRTHTHTQTVRARGKRARCTRARNVRRKTVNNSCQQSEGKNLPIETTRRCVNNYLEAMILSVDYGHRRRFGGLMAGPRVPDSKGTFPVDGPGMCTETPTRIEHSVNKTTEYRTITLRTWTFRRR